MITSITVTLVLIEGGFRLYSRLARPKMMALDPVLGWRHPRGVTREFTNEAGETVLNVLNAQGNRGPVASPQPPDSTVRILALGDSFTEGWGVGENDLITTVLATAEPGLEVVNAGVGGYGTVQHYRYLSAEGLRYRPDLVLLLVYENDFTDNVRPNLPEFGPRPYAIRKDGEVRILDSLEQAPFEKFLFPVPFRASLYRHSYAYYFVNRAYQRIFAERMRALVLADYQGTSVDDMYEILFSTLDRIDELLDQQRIPLVVVHIPTREDATSGRTVTRNRLLANCTARRLRCLSLLDAFNADISRDGKRLYFPVDIHWTKAGHAAAAMAIRGHLKSSGLLDSLRSQRVRHAAQQESGGASGSGGSRATAH